MKKVLFSYLNALYVKPNYSFTCTLNYSRQKAFSQLLKAYCLNLPLTKYEMCVIYSRNTTALYYQVLCKLSNLKIKIYGTIILPVVLYGCETWSLTLREESKLRVFENMVLWRIFGPWRDEVTWGNGGDCITRS